MVFYIFFSIVIRINKSQKCFWRILFIMISCLVFLMVILNNISDMDKYFTYMVYGYLLSPLLVFITYRGVFGAIPNIKISFAISWDILFSVILEEIIWRHLFLNLLHKQNNNLCVNICMCAVQLFFFVVAHRNIGSLRRGIEMYVFSGLLLMTAYLFPGMNIGIHLGRNVSCMVSGGLINEQNEYIRN